MSFLLVGLNNRFWASAFWAAKFLRLSLDLIEKECTIDISTSETYYIDGVSFILVLVWWFGLIQYSYYMSQNIIIII